MNDDPKIPKGLRPTQAFIYALLLLFGGAVVWVYDNFKEWSASKELAELNKQMQVCTGAKAAAETGLTAAKNDLVSCQSQAEEDVRKAQDKLDAALRAETGRVEQFLNEYKTLIKNVATERQYYEAAKNNLDALPERRRAVMSTATALVNFVKQWRAITPYLCSLLDGNIESMDQGIQRGDPDEVLNMLQRVQDTFNGQQQMITTLVQQAVSKPAMASPCLCTPTAK